MKLSRLNTPTARFASIVSIGAFASIALLTGTGLLWKSHAAGQPGEQLATTFCAACHQTGVGGAPKLGDEADWKARLEPGIDTLVKNAIDGIKGMPPRGGNSTLTDQQVKDAVVYMVGLLPSSADSAVQEAAAETPGQAEPSQQPEQTTIAPTPQVATVNTFNRLMAPKSKRNPPPVSDGIHDPANQATEMLQPPAEAFATLPKSTGGNYVDWVNALSEGQINPRFDRLDDTAEPMILDMNIIREVKGTMPNVVYPHKQHTEWLDCSNCHPAIFVPQKGGNQISMAAILLGEKCGVCHGKVAFPVSDCRRCHSQKKSASLQ